MIPTDILLGLPFEVQLNIPFQVNDNQNIQQTGSMLHLVAGESRIQKNDLPSTDKDNVDCVCDLLILKIIETIGWNLTAD